MNIFEILSHKDSNNPLLKVCNSNDFTNNEACKFHKVKLNTAITIDEPVSLDDACRFVSKKLAKSFRKGEIGVAELIQSYKKNRLEAETFCSFGYKIQDLQDVAKSTHNPALKLRVQKLINEKRILRNKSNDQNKVTLAKLETFKNDVLESGIGLRAIISRMKKYSKRNSDVTAKIITLLLETEFANVNAKRLPKEAKRRAYERKVILLTELAPLLSENKWKFGYNDATGKNASYLVFVYLPNDAQLTWHCNEYTIPQYFDHTYDEWDGQVCMTMEKILSFILNHYLFVIKPVKIAA